ncbi:hypothetical protein, partial [Halorubrum lacusprofundi]
AFLVKSGVENGGISGLLLTAGCGGVVGFILTLKGQVFSSVCISGCVWSLISNIRNGGFSERRFDARCV